MCASCVFFVLINVSITLRCVYYLGDFDQNISDVRGTKHNSIKILPQTNSGKENNTL